MTASSPTTAAAAALAVLVITSSVSAFAPIASTSTSTSLKMGMFDGKDAIETGSPSQQQGDGLVSPSERETPIDRWFNWNTKSEEEIKREQAANPLSPQNFVDTMDAKNYITIELTKPMGVVFEENDNSDFGGIYVSSLAEGGNAERSNALMKGDQLVSVGNTKVSGLEFDDAFNIIVDSSEDTLKLVLFRGNAKLFYGPTGPSEAWLDDFIAAC